MNSDQEEQDWQITKSTLRERFRELLNLSQWTDCTFVVGEDNIEINCHKLVLAVSSPVFEALFFGKLSNPSNDPIRVPDIDPHTFKLLLMYIYSDSLNLHTIDEAGSLLYASKKYLMPQLSRVCVEFLVDRTCIQTMWDILAIAEAFDEEELSDAVLKVMCRFGKHVWYNKSETLSATMLNRLLNESNMNMAEEDLWSIVLDWAEKDCISKGLFVNGRNIREALERENLLEKIRFLVFNSDKFMEKVIETGVLNQSEIYIINRVIDPGSSEGKLPCNEIPTGLCKINIKRKRVCRAIWKCNRERIKGEPMWISSEKFMCTVASHNLVLVTGVEVPTRSIYSARECYRWEGSLQHPAGTYNETLSVDISDENGCILVSTTYDAWVPYDTVQIIKLEEEVWFDANKNYDIVISFKFTAGSYELHNLARTVQSKGTVFSFQDSSLETLSQLRSKPKYCGSFVTSILYCF